MARDRDDDSRDDDSRDDRPRRRRDDDAPKKGGKGWLVALIIVGGILLVCGGAVAVVGYFISQGVQALKQGVEQFAGSVQATQEANTFLDLLKTAPDSAYTRTTDGYQKKVSKEQFTKLLKDHPVLTVENYHTQGTLPTPTGTAPNRTVSATYTVIAGTNPNPDDEGGSMTTGKKPTAPKPAPPTTTSTAPKPKDVTVVVTLVEQAGGSWKVDGFEVK